MGFVDFLANSVCVVCGLLKLNPDESAEMASPRNKYGRVHHIAPPPIFCEHPKNGHSILIKFKDLFAYYFEFYIAK